MRNSDIWHPVIEPIIYIMYRIEALTQDRLPSTGTLRLTAYQK